MIMNEINRATFNNLLCSNGCSDTNIQAMNCRWDACKTDKERENLYREVGGGAKKLNQNKALLGSDDTKSKSKVTFSGTKKKVLKGKKG